MASLNESGLIKKGSIEPRSYQEKLAKSALEKGNSLIVAPTALGKTVIAALIAAALLEKDEKAKVLFLAPTKPLAMQHQKSFIKFLKTGEEKINTLSGSVKPSERKEIWEKSRVILATPQTIRNDLQKGRICLGDVKLCIFDEAHRAIGDYSYVEIAEEYMKQASSPLILALTASPGSKREKIEAVCKNLFIKNIELKTHKDEDVQQYTHEIKIEWIKVELPAEFARIINALNSFTKKQLLTLKKMFIVNSTDPRHYNKKRLLGLQQKVRKLINEKGKSRPILFSAATALAAIMKASHASMLLETQGINSFTGYMKRKEAQSREERATKALKKIFADDDIKKGLELAEELQKQGIDHPKKEELKRILEKQFRENSESNAIVFNHYRDSINNLVEFLNKSAAIKARRFVGQASKGKEKGMSQKEQADIISDLKERKFNCLVGSSVAEEGLDIPSVDLVVFYEPVPSEIRSIQRRGRTGRFAEGKAVILMAKGTRDEAFYWSAFHKEKKMHSTLHKMKQAGEKKAVGQTTLHAFKG